MKKLRYLLLLVIPVFILCSFITFHANGATIYKDYLPGKDLNSGLIYEPTLVLECNDVNELNSDSLNYVTSLIIDIDKDCNVIMDNQEYQFEVFFNEYIKGKYVPIVRLNKDNYQGFINYYKTTLTIYDLMIISSDLDIIGEIYNDSDTYILNSVYDMTGVVLPSSRFNNWEYVSECNKVGCNILLANSNDINYGVFTEYVQAMTKVAWGSGSSLIEAVNTISNGSYGVVSNKTSNLVDAIKLFSKNGWHHSQYVAAHRGITKYCNENSLTGCLAAYSEGATHIEVDLQVLADENIILCHNSETNYNSNKNGWYFVNVLLSNLKSAKLNDYNINYDETYTTLEELVLGMLKTDVIMILELKFDNGSSKAVDELKCIENFKRIMDSIPESYGHFYAITFFAPLAEKMKELMPEIPLGYLGGARSGKETEAGETAWLRGGGHRIMINYLGKISFCRHYNIGLDETYTTATTNGEYYSNLTASFFLARGYVQNTWTYEDISHFSMKTSVATTNAAEECSRLIKTIDNSPINLSKSELDKGIVKVKTYSYNGWMEYRDCEIIVVYENGSNIKALLYCYEDRGTTSYGLYSKLIDITVS